MSDSELALVLTILALLDHDESVDQVRKVYQDQLKKIERHRQLHP